MGVGCWLLRAIASAICKLALTSLRGGVKAIGGVISIGAGRMLIGANGWEGVRGVWQCESSNVDSTSPAF